MWQDHSHAAFVFHGRGRLPSQGSDSPRGAEDPDPGGGQVEKPDAERFAPRRFDLRTTRFTIKLKYFSLIVKRVVRRATLLGTNLALSRFRSPPPSGVRAFVPPRGFGALASEGGLD